MILIFLGPGLSLGLEVQGLGLEGQRLGLEVQSLGLDGQGLEVQCLGLEVYGLDNKTVLYMYYTVYTRLTSVIQT